MNMTVGIILVYGWKNLSCKCLLKCTTRFEESPYDIAYL